LVSSAHDTTLEVRRIRCATDEHELLGGLQSLECRNQVLQALVGDEPPDEEKVSAALETQLVEDGFVEILLRHLAAEWNEVVAPLEATLELRFAENVVENDGVRRIRCQVLGQPQVQSSVPGPLGTFPVDAVLREKHLLAEKP